MSIKESLEKVKEHEAYIILGHGNLEIHEDDPNLFIKVPNNLIVMLTSNDIDTIMYANDEIKFYKNVVKNNYYIQESLLVNNEDLDKHHYLKNKAIYMPGSCIPNFYLDLEKDKEEPLNSYGIFNTNDLDIKDNILSPDKIVCKHLIQNNIRLSEILRDMNKGHKKILFINICYTLYFPDDTIQKKYTHIIFSEEFVKFLRECQLDSLEKFTKKFTCFKKDIPKYLTTKFDDEYYDYEDENKIRNKKILNDVSKYFSTLPLSSKSSNSIVDRYKSYSNSILSNLDKMDDIEYSSNKLVNKSLSKKFNKILSENIKKILPVSKSVGTKLRKFNQSLRKKTPTKRKRKSSSSSDIRNSSPKNLRRSKRIRINSKKNVSTT